jgi:hypothetical protein
MAIQKVITDYTNRKKDISILQYADPYKAEAQMVMPAFSKGGRFCTGVQKTLQKYLIILLTNIGSQEKYPNFGTSFSGDLIYKSGALDSITAEQIFVLANTVAVNAIKSYQINKNDIPLDERLVSAVLKNVVILNITVNGKPQKQVGFDIKITTEAGDAIDYVLPLPK